MKLQLGYAQCCHRLADRLLVQCQIIAWVKCLFIHIPLLSAATILLFVKAIEPAPPRSLVVGFFPSLAQILLLGNPASPKRASHHARACSILSKLIMLISCIAICRDVSFSDTIVSTIII